MAPSARLEELAKSPCKTASKETRGNEAPPGRPFLHWTTIFWWSRVCCLKERHACSTQLPLSNSMSCVYEHFKWISGWYRTRTQKPLNSATKMVATHATDAGDGVENHVLRGPANNWYIQVKKNTYSLTALNRIFQLNTMAFCRVPVCNVHCRIELPRKFTGHVIRHVRREVPLDPRCIRCSRQLRCRNARTHRHGDGNRASKSPRPFSTQNRHDGFTEHASAADDWGKGFHIQRNCRWWSW